MTAWLLTAAVALAVAVWGARKVGARGEWPHDSRFDDIDGEGPQ